MILKNKEAYLTITAQLVQLFCAILLLKFLASTLTKSDFANYSLIMAMLSLITTLPFTSLLQGYMRYVSIYTQRGLFKKYYQVVILITLILLFICVFFLSLVNYLFELPSFLAANLLGFLFLVLTEVIKITTRGIENAKRNRTSYALSILIEFSVKLTLLYMSYKYLGYSSLSVVILAFSVANLLSIIATIRKKELYRFEVGCRFLSIISKRLLLFSSPLIIWAGFGWARDMSGRWLLDFYTDKNDVAVYALMASIAMIIPTVLQSSIGAYLVPILYENENKQPGYTRKILFKLIPALLFFVIIGTIVCNFSKVWLVTTFASEKYKEGAWMLPFMFFSYSIFIVSMMSTYEIFAYKQTKLMLWPNLISGVTSIFLGLILTPFYGLEGMVVTYTLSYLSYAILAFALSLKFNPQSYKRG